MHQQIDNDDVAYPIFRGCLHKP